MVVKTVNPNIKPAVETGITLAGTQSAPPVVPNTPITNVNDLSVKTRQKIADTANKAGMTAEQVKAQLNKVGVTETNPVVPVAPITPVVPPVINPSTGMVDNSNIINSAKNSGQLNTEKGVTDFLNTPNPNARGNLITDLNKKAGTSKKNTKVIQPIEPIQAPISIEDWKTKGSTISGLEQLIESKYNTTLTNENGVLKGNIGGVNYQWNIDEAGNPIKTKAGGENPDDIYNMLSTGQTIPDTGVKTTKAYSTGKARYDIASKYNSYTEDQLYSAYVNGEIGSQLEKDLVNNPYLSVVKEKFNKKNITDNINKDSTTMLNAYNKANGKEIVAKTEEKTFLEKLSDRITESFANKGNDIVSFKDYMSANHPDLVNDTKELNQKNTDLKKIVDERDARLDNIIKENPGISINRATMLSARQNKEVNEQIKSMSYEIGNLQANINYQTDMADKEYNYELKRKDKQDQLDAEQRGMQFDLLKTAQAQDYQTKQTAETRNYNEQQAQKQLTDKFNYEYGDLQSTNPQVQKVASERIASAIQKQYEGMPFRRDVSTMGADILSELKSGKTIEQITSEIATNVQNAPAYNNWATNKGLIAKSETPKVEKITDAQGNQVNATYNPQTQQWEQVNVSGLTGGDLFKQMTSSTNPIGVYATGDISGDRHKSIYNTAVSKGLDAFVNQYKGTNITVDMINQSANQYGIDPLMLASTMAMDSSMGTKGKGARNNNPGNIGQFDSLDAKGITVKGYKTLQEGVDAVSNNLSKRLKALGGNTTTSGIKTYSDTQKSIMGGIDAKNLSKIDLSTLNKNGLTESDIYSYKTEQKKGKWSEGLDDIEFKRVNTLQSDFYSSPVSKEFDLMQGAYETAKKVSKGNKGSDNQALVYAFAKAMDPGSVVRESEYATVQRFSQTIAEQYGMNVNRFINGQEFLSAKAKENIVNTIKSKYEGASNNYNQTRKTYIANINDVTGKTIGDKVIPSNAIKTVTPTKKTTPVKQKSVKSKNGNTYTY